MTDLTARAPGPAPDAATAAIVAHAGVRERIAALVVDLDPAVAAATTVPACPAWSVTDTLAHVVGVCIDIVDGNIGDDVGTAPWADSHVTRFSSLGIDGLLARWQETGPTIDSLAGLLPARVASQFCFDATTHEHDLRAALGHPGARDSDGVEVGLRFIELALDAAIRNAGLAPIALESEHDRVVVGLPDGAAAGEGDLPVLRADRFTQLRSFGGRRSLAQLRSLPWDVDPEPYLGLLAFGPLRPPDVDLD